MGEVIHSDIFDRQKNSSGTHKRYHLDPSGIIIVQLAAAIQQCIERNVSIDLILPNGHPFTRVSKNSDIDTLYSRWRELMQEVGRMRRLETRLKIGKNACFIACSIDEPPYSTARP